MLSVACQKWCLCLFFFLGLGLHLGLGGRAAAASSRRWRVSSALAVATSFCKTHSDAIERMGRAKADLEAGKEEGR